jgi:hypothetical protein
MLQLPALERLIPYQDFCWGKWKPPEDEGEEGRFLETERKQKPK